MLCCIYGQNIHNVQKLWNIFKVYTHWFSKTKIYSFRFKFINSRFKRAVITNTSRYGCIELNLYENLCKCGKWKTWKVFINKHMYSFVLFSIYFPYIFYTIFDCMSSRCLNFNVIGCVHIVKTWRELTKFSYYAKIKVFSKEPTRAKNSINLINGL